ncbi:MAG: glycosyltransferase [Gaiellaceae bacterium]
MSLRQQALQPSSSIASVVVLRRALRQQQSRRRSLVRSLEAHGVRAQVCDDGAIGEPSDLLLALGNGRWFPKSLRRLTALPHDRRPLVAFWQDEPLPLPPGAGLPVQRLHLRELAKIALRDRRVTDPGSNARFLERLALHGLPDLLVVTSRGSAEFLGARGIAAAVVPNGYAPTYGRDLQIERDIDVLFLGALEVPRRKRVLRALRARGLKVEAVGGWHDQRFWGDRRTELLNRVKIFLNLSRFPGQFAGVRLLLGMANRALVVSEPIYEPDPFLPGTHYVSAATSELPDVIDHYLAAEQERLDIASEGHFFVTRELTMERSVGRILSLAEERLRR